MHMAVVFVPLALGLAAIAYGLGERAARKQIEEWERDLDLAMERAANVDH